VESAELFSWREREALLPKLDGKIYDLAIIGGGITGAAIARDAAQRGFSVLLIEKNDFASGTSSRSSKLVHGGVRYLEHGEFGLVAESTRERAVLWKLAPDLVSPMPFLFPAYEDSRVPLWKLDAGLWLYELLAAFRMPSLHKKYDRRRTHEEEPLLRDEKLTGSVFYWDGATDDARLTLATILDARRLGAEIFSRMEVQRVLWDANVGRSADAAHSLKLRDVLRGRSHDARARIIVSAAGPWTDEVLKRSGYTRPRLLAPTRGSHIVVSRKRLNLNHAVVMTHPEDGRVLFGIPWGDATIIGTTDVFEDKGPDSLFIQPAEVEYLLDAANFYFPLSLLLPDDVLSTWAGLRPLLAPPEGTDEGATSREHHIRFEDPGLLVVAGGKLTTHREMAEEALEKIYNGISTWAHPPGKGYAPARTHQRPLPGMPFPRPRSAEVRIGLSQAGLMGIEDVIGICRTQMVLTLEDFMVRRTHLFYKEPLNGLELLPKLKEILCRELGWDEAEWKVQRVGYKDFLIKAVYEPLGRKFPAIALDS
jgi:glycerol-3-phosphate dehydrogenase